MSEREFQWFDCTATADNDKLCLAGQSVGQLRDDMVQALARADVASIEDIDMALCVSFYRHGIFNEDVIDTVGVNRNGLVGVA
ncbi:hypothetical protein D3C75_1147640 [compost metagenome]